MTFWVLAFVFFMNDGTTNVLELPEHFSTKQECAVKGIELTRSWIEPPIQGAISVVTLCGKRDET